MRKLGIKFNEIFSLVVKITIVIVLLAFVEAHGLELDKLEVKTIFLDGDIKEKIDIDYPNGYKERRKGHLTCILNKSMYWIKIGSNTMVKKI